MLSSRSADRAYLAPVGERSTSAQFCLTDALFPRTRRVASGWRSSCESGCHEGSGKSAIQSRSLLAAHRCLPCCRTRRASSQWSRWKQGSGSGSPSRTALRSFALMTQCGPRSHYLCAWKEKGQQIAAVYMNQGEIVTLGNFRDLATPTLSNLFTRSRKSLNAHTTMLIKAEKEAFARLIDSILSVATRHHSIPCTHLSLSLFPPLFAWDWHPIAAPVCRSANKDGVRVSVGG